MESQSQSDEHGGLRGLARSYKQDYRAREIIRMLNRGWKVPPDQVEQVRNSIIDVAKNSEDPRAKVSAATFLFNAEVAIEQEEHLMNAGQVSQITEAKPEPIDPE